MESIQLRLNFSRNILIRMFLLGGLAAGVLIWKLDLINSIYFRDQLTPTGLVINGSILLLFALGLIRIVWILSRAQREERAVQQVMENLAEGVTPLLEVAENSIIGRRYNTMEALHNSNTPINHGALASTLVATESTQNSFPKFINNILILSGVFGTIVSLSIALVGASGLLESAVNVDGMGMVVHGMSTALSTTITAILCYLFYSYFFLKMTDAQTNLISAVEQITNNYFVPRFQIKTETVLHQFAGLIRSLQGLIGQMRSSQDFQSGLLKEMRNVQGAQGDLEGAIVAALTEAQRIQGQPIAAEMDQIKALLRIGFRLPEQS